jgi:hypothetical protein
VHRRVGNRIQAGRWDYLTIGADRRDTGAFERAFPSAVARLREVRWPHRAGQAATAYARQRLAKLMAAAAAERPSPARNKASVRAATTTTAVRDTAPGGTAVREPAAAGTTAVREPAAAGSAASRPAAGPAAASTPAGRFAAIPLTALPGLLAERFRRPASMLALGAAALVMIPLAAVGLVTVVQWIV